MKQRRSREEVIFDMLDAIKKKGGTIKPTHLLYKANLSHDAMRRYLAELLSAGLMQEQQIKKKKFYALTDNGYHFIERYQKFREFSEAFGI